MTLPVYKTRLSILWSVLRPSHLLVVLSYMLLGGGASYCLAELAGYHWLWYPHQRYIHVLGGREGIDLGGGGGGGGGVVMVLSLDKCGGGGLNMFSMHISCISSTFSPAIDTA